MERTTAMGHGMHGMALHCIPWGKGKIQVRSPWAGLGSAYQRLHYRRLGD